VIRNVVSALVLICISVAAVGCLEDSDDVQRHAQEQLSKQGNAQAGMPSIVNFQEKKNMKMILELRDSENLATITYTQDMDGVLHKLCNSVGYPLPYATQYTNPMRVTEGGRELPQADPNGLFSPANAEGTWVLCYNKKGDKLSPVYVEPRVIASPFELSGGDPSD
jgi:hypothetical protein